MANSNDKNLEQLGKIDIDQQPVEALNIALQLLTASNQEVYNFLTGSPVASIQSGQIQRDASNKVVGSAMQWVEDYLKKNRADGVFHHPILGEIILARSGAKDTASKMGADVHINALPAVPIILENSVLLEKSIDKDGKPIANYILAAPVLIDNQKFYAVVRLRQDTRDKNSKPRFYVVAAELESEAQKNAALTLKTRSADQDQENTGGKNRLLNVLHQALSVNNPNANVVTGRSNPVKTAQGTKLDTVFALVEADQLIASHDATGGTNPKFPQELQPRDRSRDSSQAWVQKTAANLDPDSLGKTGRADTGAPIIGDDLVVESGNGRTMAIQLAYTRGTAQEYKDWLIDEATYFGFKPEQVEAMQQPVLVRIRKTPIDRAAFAVEANQDDKLSFSATERAKSDAKRIDDNMTMLFSPSDDGDLLAASNVKFIQAFLNSLGDTEAAQYITTDGKPTQALVARIKAAIFSKAYADDRLLEMVADQTKPDLQNMLNALSVAAPKFIEAQALDRVKAEDLSSHIVDGMEQAIDKRVINAIIDAANVLMSAKHENQDVAEFVKQQGLFGDLPEGVPELAVFLAQNSRSSKKMSLLFKGMAEYLEKQAFEQSTIGLFGDPEPVKMQDVIAYATSIITQEYGDKANLGMFDSSGMFNPELFDQIFNSCALANKVFDDTELLGLNFDSINNPALVELVGINIEADPVAALDACLRVMEFAPGKYIPVDQNLEYSLDVHDQVMQQLLDGTLSIADYQQSFKRMARDVKQLATQVEKLTKPQIFQRTGPYFEYRYKNDKKDQVTRAYLDNVLRDYNLESMFSYSPPMGGTLEDARNAMLQKLKQGVDATTQEQLDSYAQQHQVERNERIQAQEAKLIGLQNPQSLDDFINVLRTKVEEGGLTINQARMQLTPEQRKQYDLLSATKSRGERLANKENGKAEIKTAVQTSAGTIIESTHTKHGHDLFIVQLADRVDRDSYSVLNANAKKLGGYYSSFRGNGAIVGFQFKTRDAADAFLKLAGGDVAEAQQQANEKRDAFLDDKTQSAAERLTTMAERLQEQAQEALERPRKANTARRARMAASAELDANKDKALAQTMLNIASSLKNGDAQFLNKVRQKVQVEYLAGLLNSAKWDEVQNKDIKSDSERQNLRNAPPTLDTVDYVTFPSYTAYRSDLATLARKMMATEGMKAMGQKLFKVADDTSAEYEKFAKDNLNKVSRFTLSNGQYADFATKKQANDSIERGGFNGRAIALLVAKGQTRIILSPSEAIQQGIWQGSDKRITLSNAFGHELMEKVGAKNRKGADISLPWTFESTFEAHKRLQGMELVSAPELRSALREFVLLQASPEEPDQIKQLERSMVGRGNDGLDFFPTPETTVREMIQIADIKEGMTVLEPSAGMGHIAEMIQAEGVEPDVVEFSSARRELLELKGFNVVGDDFLKITKRTGFTFGDTFRTPEGIEGIMRGSNGGNRVGLVDTNGTKHWVFRDTLEGVKHNGSDSGYDRIIMNPPFSNRQDAKHVQHAYGLLNAGGRLVSIMGEGVFFGQDKAAVDFRNWLERIGGTSEKLGENTFMDPNLPVNTGANARLVVIEK